MNEFCTIEIAFDKMEEVDQVCNTLLEENLVCACQIVEANSIWLWRGAKEKEKEYLLFLKTKKNLSDKIYEIVKKYHSYETFEFSVFSLTSPNQEYLNWINNETRGISNY